MARETFYPGETFTFIHKRKAYVATIERDDSMVEPWSEHDGHGEVSEWTKRAKLPGEMVLSESGQHKRFYDFAGACRTARAEGWGSLPGEMIVDRFAHHGARKFRAYVAGDKPELTAYGKDQSAAISALYDLYRDSMGKRAYAAAAAMSDFKRLRDWCNDEWQWIGIVVRPAGECTCCGRSESLWGIESDCGEYAKEIAADLAEQLRD